MSEPEPYRWDFDRSAWDARPGATTFSVGVYQWLPKASANGLKKSGTIRVNGYVADAAAVYAKAAEVCRQLNEAGARSGALPTWVRKQYSVPRPAGVSVPARQDRLSGDAARRVRNKVAKASLLPTGFVQGHASTYVRRVGEVVQMVHFQTGTWGGEFTVNLGLHPVFTPPASARKRMPWSRMDLHDFTLRGRLGFFLPKKRDTWFAFEDDPAALAERFEYAVEKSVAALDRYTPRVEDAAKVLSGARKQVRPFEILYPTVFFASVEMRLGRLDDAKRRLRDPLLPEHRDNVPRHEQLLDVIGRLRKAKGSTARARKLREWLTD